MSISKDRVKNINPVDDEYICPICLHVLWKPVECQNCQRMFCKSCIDECLKQKPNVCPLCKHYQEKRCSLMFYALLCKFKIECENKNNGCENILLYESLDKHQQEQCEYQIKLCRGCQKGILKKDLNDHEQICGHFEIECKRCSLVYKKKDQHEQLDCVMNMLNQSNKRSASLKNIVENQQTQLDCVMNMLDQSNKKIVSLQNLVDKLQRNLQTVENALNTNEVKDLLKGVSHNILLSSLSLSWEIIYDFPYSHTTTVEELRELRPQCNNNIIVGAMQGDSAMTLSIAAMGPAEVLSLDSPLNQPTKFRNVYWYLTPNRSFGFAPSSTTINCNTADTGENDHAENRLSWHLNKGGYRAGAFTKLNDSSEWRKIIMTEKN